MLDVFRIRKKGEEASCCGSTKADTISAILGLLPRFSPRRCLPSVPKHSCKAPEMARFRLRFSVFVPER
jgi:hypothetical protein